ncbi:MAG: GreA/GreB family elongation factor [Dehalococcoidales bacterium]|nr:GreA/GreB family elongation factor [Dehalococcoidales bacterium]
MVQCTEQSMSLEAAASLFLAKLSPSEKEASQTEVNHFVRWLGRDTAIGNLTAHSIEKYAEQLSQSDTDYARKLELLRAFLVYAKRVGWTKASLAPHLKAKKTKTAVASRVVRESVELTEQGYTKLKEELASLKNQRIEVIEEVRRAAADKDFRENAPYHAAREHKGHIDGRIIEIEETMKLAVVIDGEKKSDRKVGMGDSIVLCEAASGRELNCMIVHPKEVDPGKGKISNVSPIGKAVLGRSEGETVEVVVPAGRLRYQIKQIQR